MCVQKSPSPAELFDALGASGAKTFEEIVSSPEGVRKVYRALKSSDESSRKLVNDLLGTFAHKSAGEAKKATRDTLDQLRQGAKDVASTAVSRLRQNKEE